MTRSETPVARRKLDIRPTILLLGMMTVLAVASCDSTDSPGPGPGVGTATTVAPTSGPPDGGSPPPPGSGSDGSPEPTGTTTDVPSALGYVERYRERCLRETGTPDAVTPFFDGDVELELSRPHRFRLELASTGSQVEVPGAQPHTKIRVACTVRARLVTAPTELEVSPASWEPQEYLPPEPASWTWVVTARSYGTSEAVLKLRPVMRVSDDSGKVLDRAWTTEEYDVTFTAKRPPEPDKPTLVVIGDFLEDSWKALIAFAAGVTVIVGAIVAVRGLRRKPTVAPGDHAKPSEGTDRPDGP